MGIIRRPQYPQPSGYSSPPAYTTALPTPPVSSTSLTLEREARDALEIHDHIPKNDGVDDGHPRVGLYICDVFPSEPALWVVKATGQRLSGRAAMMLEEQGHLDLKDLEKYVNSHSPFSGD
jgi:hypothetical protein